jgi:hypothetical protein
VGASLQDQEGWQPIRATTLQKVTKLGVAEKTQRVVSAKVAKSRRKDVVDRAASRVSAKARINFRRAVRD